jgi:hypothetical protein
MKPYSIRSIHGCAEGEKLEDLWRNLKFHILDLGRNIVFYANDANTYNICSAPFLKQKNNKGIITKIIEPRFPAKYVCTQFFDK